METTTPCAPRRPASSTTTWPASRPPASPLIGISPDDATSHQRFRNKYGLRFPLLTDADHTVMDAWGEKTSYGRKSVGVLRSTFLLDEDGRIDRAWHNVKADGHAASVLSQLQS